MYWKQAREMSQVYLCTNPASLGVLCLWCSSATRGIAAGKLLHQHPCLPHTHHPNTGLLHGDGIFFSPSLPHIYSCCKDVTPYHVWHGEQDRIHCFCQDLVHAHRRLYTVASWQQASWKEPDGEASLVA